MTFAGRRVWLGLATLVVMGGVLCWPAMGQAIARKPASQPAGTKQSASDSSVISTYSVGRVVLALGLVIGGILILRWCGVRMMGGAARGKSSRAISVLSRTIIAPRQQLMLIQVGRRLVLVANTGNQMNTLCEIRDADEATELMGLIQSEKGDSVARSFSSLFGGVGERFQRDIKQPVPEIEAEAAEDSPVEGKDITATRQELDGLRDKVKGLARMLGK